MSRPDWKHDTSDFHSGGRRYDRERAIQEGFAAGLLFGFVLGAIIAVAVML